MRAPDREVLGRPRIGQPADEERDVVPLAGPEVDEAAVEERLGPASIGRHGGHVRQSTSGTPSRGRLDAKLVRAERLEEELRRSERVVDERQ